MKTILFAFLGVSLLSFSTLSAAEAVPQAAAAETPSSLMAKIAGCWVIDFDSAETKAFIVAQGVDASSGQADEALAKEMAATLFEFKEGSMTIYEESMTSLVRISVKSEDVAKRTIVADFQSEHDDPVETTLQLDGDRITLGAQNDEGKLLRFGFKRIDRKEFDKRVAAFKEAAPPAEPPATADGIPLGIPVPDKPGFVFSPYNRKVVDVRELPSGTLVMDPHFKPSEKKYFRVP